MAAIALACLAGVLAGCMGIDVSSIRRADGAAPPPGEAVATGTIRFVVDGRPLTYGLLNKPALQLFHRGEGRLMTSPETASDGRYRWRLPAGEYGVALIRGGMSPTDQPHWLPGGGLVFVHGLVDPGIEFRLESGREHDLGTLVIEVESRAPTSVINLTGERVFGRLLGIRVEPGASPSPVPAIVPTPMRRIAAGAYGRSR